MEETIRAGKNRMLMKAEPSGQEVPQEQIDDFFARLAECCNVTRAARRAGVSRTTMYRMRSRDSAFAAAWQEAIEAGYERLELGLIEAALARVERTGDDGEPEAEGDGAAKRVVEALSMDQAIHLLGRYRATVGSGKRQSIKRGARRVPTSEETDEAILKRLAILRRQRGWDQL